MEFLFTIMLLAMFFAIGLKTKSYNARVRLALISISAIAPLWFFIIWQGQS